VNRIKSDVNRYPAERLSPGDAARALGVSYATVKQWIYRKKIRSVRTPGGHHRIPHSEIARLQGAVPGAGGAALEQISGRNKLAGVVTQVRSSGLLSEVTIDVGGQYLTAIITRTSAEQLKLQVGRPAVALIKATEVMVIGGG
jgi:molybdopterin-binding protein